MSMDPAVLAKHGIFVHRSFISPSDAARIIFLTEKHLLASEDHSSSLQPADYAQRTHDIEVCRSPALRSFLQEIRLVPRVSTIVARHYSKPIACFDDIFVVKYSMDQQRSLVSHVDGGSVSFMVALSSSCSYSGGGTRFAVLPGSLPCCIGDCLTFPAELYHEGVPITSGARYLLVGFSWQACEQLRVRGNVSLGLKELRGCASRFDVMKFETQEGALRTLRKDVQRRMEEGKTYFMDLLGTAAAEEGRIEHFVRRVVTQHIARLNLKKVSGGEFWFSSSTSGMPLHYDKDEVLLRTDGILRRPLLATVTYLAEGSEVPTLVFGEDESVVSYPSVGNHLSFHGSLLHGVCDELTRGEGEERGGKKVKRARFTFMLNLWKDVPRLDDMAKLKNIVSDHAGPKKDDYMLDDYVLEYAPFSEIECGRATVYCPGGDVDNFEVDPEAFVTTELARLKSKFDEDTSSVFVLVPSPAEGE